MYKNFIKNIICIFTAILVAIQVYLPVNLYSLCAKAEDSSLKVLALGNSFSQDAVTYLYKIAEDGGFSNVVIGNMVIGGCTLATHWANAKSGAAAYTYVKDNTGTPETRTSTPLLYGLTDEDWDVIVLQQHSGVSGVSSTYNSDLTSLVNYVKTNKTNPNAKLAWHMTWAYQSDSTHNDFPRYDKNQMTMYNAIVDAAQTKIATNDSFDIIIPAGTAIQNTRTSYLGDNLTRDGYHLTFNMGRYIAGLTWFKSITGLSIDNITYYPNPFELPAEQFLIIKEAVNNAVATPFAVTRSAYQTNPDKNLLKNGGFESGEESWSNTGKAKFSITEEDKYSGAKSLKLASGNTSHTSSYFQFGKKVEVQANTNYVFSFNYKVVLNSNGEVPLPSKTAVVDVRASGTGTPHLVNILEGSSVHTNSGLSPKGLTMDGKWHKYTVVFNTKTYTTLSQIGPRDYLGVLDTTYYFDNFELRAVNDSEVFNGGFEEDTFPWFLPTAAPGKLSADNTVAHSGASSLKLISGGDKDWNSVYHTFINLTPNKNYRLSFYYKYNGASGPKLYLSGSMTRWYGDSNDDFVTHTLVGSEADWNYYSATFNSEGRDKMVIRFRDAAALGEVCYFDDVKLEMVDEIETGVSFNIESLTGGQHLTASVNVNNHSDRTLNIQAFMGLYDKNSGRLLNASGDSDIFTSKKSDQLLTSFTLPTDVTDKIVKVFIWDYDTMSPYHQNAVELE